MTQQPTLDFWFEFASTYSYPAAIRIGPLARARGVALRWRPFLLGPVFKQNGWTTSPFNLYPAKGRYMWRDLERICATMGLPFAEPPQFPQNTILPARVALIAFEDGWGEAFTAAVYRAQFGEKKNIGEAETVTAIIRALGKVADDAIGRALSDDNKLRLRQQCDEAIARGIFGAPSFITADGELFWGNDTLEDAVEWAAARKARSLDPSS